MITQKNLLKHPFWAFLKEHPRAVGLGIGFLFITNGLDAIWPLVLKQGIDLLEQKAQLSELTKACVMFLTIMIGLALTRYGWRRYFGEFHTFSAEILRQISFKHLNTLTSSFYQKNSVGELMSLMTNDIQSFRQAIGPGFLIFADGIIIMAFVVPLMVYLNASWTWKCLILLPLLPVMIWKVMRLIHSTYKTQQDRFAELTGFCHETVGGIRVIKGFAREEHRLNEFEDMNQKFMKASQKNSLVDSLFSPVMEFGAASGSAILLFIAAPDVIQGTSMSIGAFVAFHRYIQKMVWPMSALGFGISYFQKGFASFDRISEVLKTEPEVKDSGTKILTHFESLEFKNVSFKYAGSQVWALRNINFKIDRLQNLAVIGSIGSGKSTLFQLMSRLFPVTEGEILINGINICEYTLESLRTVLKIIPQEVFLYSRSVKENLSLPGHSESHDELTEALKKVQIYEEMMSLPVQLDSQLGEKGVNLSGGQKQRLSLARALLSPSEILILDDVLSAVDTETEDKMETEIFRDSTKTFIVAAHRLSTLKSMNLILVLNQGQVEFFGPKEQASQSRIFSMISDIQGGTHALS